MATADSLALAADTAYNDAKTLADSAVADVSTRIDEAVAVLSGLPSVASSGSVDVTNVSAASIARPAVPSDFSSGVQAAFDHAFSAFSTQIQTQVQNYLQAFFPDIAEGVKTGSDDWIIATITNGRFVPAAVETALWNRAKDRETIESFRAEVEVIDASASRGFSAPTGALNYAVAANQQESEKRKATLNRDISIKAFDTANENTKFAIQQAVALRTAFVGAMGDFIRAATVMPNNAAEYAKVVLSAKTAMSEIAVRIYSAEIDEARMRSGVLLENNAHDLQGASISFDNFHKAVATNVNKATVQANAAMQAADTLGKVAAAAMATRNSVVSVSAGV